MNNAQLYVQDWLGRQKVSSLAPAFSQTHASPNRISAERMRPQDAQRCRWLGYAYGKGVTSIAENISVFAYASDMRSGLHAELIAGFDAVDPAPLCYEDNHKLGFGSFLRWVYFVSPEKQKNFFGVDWSLAARTTLGIANSWLTIAGLSTIILAHGMLPGSELVLLNGRMQEEPILTALRNRLQLVTVEDWHKRAANLFSPDGGHCPRCANNIQSSHVFCPACGCKPELLWKQDLRVSSMKYI